MSFDDLHKLSEVIRLVAELNDVDTIKKEIASFANDFDSLLQNLEKNVSSNLLVNHVAKYELPGTDSSHTQLVECSPSVGSTSIISELTDNMMSDDISSVLSEEHKKQLVAKSLIQERSASMVGTFEKTTTFKPRRHRAHSSTTHRELVRSDSLHSIKKEIPKDSQEVLDWLNENYGSGSNKGVHKRGAVEVPERTPIQRFRQAAKFIVSQIQFARALNVDIMDSASNLMQINPQSLLRRAASFDDSQSSVIATRNSNNNNSNNNNNDQIDLPDDLVAKNTANRHSSKRRFSTVTGRTSKETFNLMKLTQTGLTNDAIISYLRQYCFDLNKFDIFEFADICDKNLVGKHCLLFVSMYIAQHCGQYAPYNRVQDCINTYRIPVAKLTKFLAKIEDNYDNSISYHNSLHACDVLQTAMFFMSNSNVMTKNLNLLDCFALFIASIIHDVGHTGTNNNFHIKTHSELAVKYNDKSVLENYHCALAFTILLKKDNSNNFVNNLTTDEKSYLRSAIIEMVLGTDMSKHQTHVNKLKKLIEIANAEMTIEKNKQKIKDATNNLKQQSENGTPTNNSSHNSSLSPMKKLSVVKMQARLSMHQFSAPLPDKSILNAANSEKSASIGKSIRTSLNTPDLANFELKCFDHRPNSPKPRINEVYNEKLFLMECLLHMSDVSNPLKPLALQLEWNRRVTEEFFAQGRTESKKFKFQQISPMCDENSSNIIKATLYFITFIVKPFALLWNQIVPENKNLTFVQNIAENQTFWESMNEQYDCQLHNDTIKITQIPGIIGEIHQNIYKQWKTEKLQDKQDDDAENDSSEENMIQKQSSYLDFIISDIAE